MEDKPQTFQWLPWVGGGLLVVTILLCVVLAEIKGRLYAHKPLPVIGPVEDFTLTNEFGRVVTLADFRGKVWVGNIIFTRCPGPCAKMTHRMRELQESLPADRPLKLVSLTTDPDYDTPAILRTYGERAGADTNRWTFLTGTKDQIYKLAVESLKLSAMEKEAGKRENPNDLFVHSTLFVIVDKQTRLRGVFQSVGEDIDAVAVRKEILAAARQLEKEE